jgi:EAL domain-containing protein (putative c-di-GMP-specific phosphodiesterase class I)
MGARIAIDNFNPTLINESVIRELECDTLKISCVDTADLQKQLSAARSLRTTIIAKEVSDAETLSALWTQHVDYVQGDYLCPPTPEPDYKFESEHELSSDNHAAPNWRISG